MRLAKTFTALVLIGLCVQCKTPRQIENSQTEGLQEIGAFLCRFPAQNCVPYRPFERIYHPGNAYIFAQLAILSYESEDKRGKPFRRDHIEQVLKSPEWGARHIEFIEVDNSHALIVDLGDSTVVAFRGTDQWKDWIDNSRSTFRRCAEFNVHHGFLAHYQRLAKSILEHTRPGQPIWLTGHSLGGALAKISALDLACQDRSIAGIYTYGAPMISGPEVGDFLAQKEIPLYQIRYGTDPVPHLPPNPLGYYQPIGTILEMFEDECPLEEKTEKKKVGLPQLARGFLSDAKNFLSPHRDHSPSHYDRCLEKRLIFPQIGPTAPAHWEQTVRPG